MRRYLIIPIFLLGSCASNLKYFQVSKKSDSFANESLARTTEEDFKSKKFTSTQDKEFMPLVFQCYLDGEGAKTDELLSKYKINKSNTAWWNGIGTCFFQRKEYSKARHYFQIALGLAKNNSEKSTVLNNLGVVYLATEYLALARSSFREAMELSPHHNLPRYNLSLIYFYLGDLKRSQELLMPLYQKYKSDVDVAAMYAKTLLSQKKLKEAKQIFSTIPEQYKGRSDVAIFLSYNHLQEEQYNDAQESLDKMTIYLGDSKEIKSKIADEIAFKIKELEKNKK